jgi:pimeloyl-ACP methyl ester carboxylesterase
MSATFDAERRRLLLGATALSAGTVLAASGCAGMRSTSVLPPRDVLQALPVPAQAPAHAAMAKLADVSLWHWDTGGSGEPVILLHPATGSGLVWSYQQPVLAHAGYRVIGYSRRGYQNSEAGPREKPGTGSEDLHALVDFLGIDRFHVLASAAGAFIAADYAVSHPERLRSLVLACSILGVQDPGVARMLADLRVPGFDNLPAYFHELGPSYRAADPDGTARWRDLEHNSVPGDHIQQALKNVISLPGLAALTAPTLLIAGDADLIAPPPLARLFAQHISKVELQVLPECGHSAYWERPELFNDVVLRFLRRHAA